MILSSLRQCTQEIPPLSSMSAKYLRLLAFRPSEAVRMKTKTAHHNQLHVSVMQQYTEITEAILILKSYLHLTGKRR